MITDVLAPLSPVAIARLDALVSQLVITRRPGPDPDETARYLGHADEDFLDAQDVKLNLRSRIKIASNVSFASVDAMLAAYGYVPPLNRRYYPDVLDVFFENTPAAALAGDMADVVARREDALSVHGGLLDVEVLTRYLRTGSDINQAVRLQLGL